MATNSEIETMLKTVINRGSAVIEAYFINNKLAIDVDGKTYIIHVTKRGKSCTTQD